MSSSHLNPKYARISNDFICFCHSTQYLKFGCDFFRRDIFYHRDCVVIKYSIFQLRETVCVPKSTKCIDLSNKKYLKKRKYYKFLFFFFNLNNLICYPSDLYVDFTERRQCQSVLVQCRLMPTCALSICVSIICLICKCNHINNTIDISLFDFTSLFFNSNILMLC